MGGGGVKQGGGVRVFSYKTQRIQEFKLARMLLPRLFLKQRLWFIYG